MFWASFDKNYHRKKENWGQFERRRNKKKDKYTNRFKERKREETQQNNIKDITRVTSGIQTWFQAGLLSLKIAKLLL